MSGPKGIAYQVWAAEEARRRELEGTRARCRSLALRLDEAEDALAAMLGGNHRSPRPEEHLLGNSRLEDLTLIEGDLAARLGTAAEELEAQRVRLVREQFAREFGSLADFWLDVRSTRVGSIQEPDSDRGHATVASLRRVVTLLQRIEDEGVRRRLVQRTQGVTAELEKGALPRARQMLLLVQTETNLELIAQQTRARIATEIAALLLTIAEVPGSDAIALRAEAMSVETVEGMARLRARVAKLRAAYDAEQDRHYVVRETRRALMELGYEVGDEFESDGHAGRAAVVTRPDLPDHGLRLQFTPQGSRLLTRVVTFTTPSPIRDAEVEVTTCRDIDGLRDKWGARGIHAELDHHRDPGSVPMSRAGVPRRTTKRRAERSKPL